MDREETRSIPTKEQLDERFQCLRYLFPVTPVSKKLALYIKHQNRKFLTGFDRLSELFNVYLALQELGMVIEKKKKHLSDRGGEEWISLVNLKLEILLKEGDFRDIDIFNSYQSLFCSLMDRNQNLLKQKPTNLFYSLGQILRSELEEYNMKFPKIEEIREELNSSLEVDSFTLDGLLERLSLP